MTKQADFERITRLVIDPITTYWGGKIPDAMAEAFIEDLSRYGDSTLSAAMASVRRTCKSMPRVAHLVDACEQIAPSRSANEDKAQAVFDDHRQRNERARRLTAEFLDGFELSDQMRAAKAEGWDVPLRDYARNAASFQSQIIARESNPGYRMMPLTHPLKQNENNLRCSEFEAACRKQAAKGVIDVFVPGYLIEEWKPKPVAA